MNQRIRYLIMILTIGLFFFVIISSLLLRVWIGLFLGIILFVTAWFAFKNLPLKVTYGLFVLSLALPLFLLPMEIRQLQKSIDHLSNKLDQGGPTAFTTYDKLTIYYLGICMGIAGAIPYPEVSKEHLYLYVPGKKQRKWKSDFPMSSSKVKKEVGEFEQLLASSSFSASEMIDKTIRIKFDYKEDPLRQALALNPLTLHMTATPINDTWLLSTSAQVNIRYPQKAKTTLPLIRNQKIQIEEGLFWSLQELGWLFPYQAVWHWEKTIPREQPPT